MDFDRELAKFRLHEFRTPKSDWDAAFEKWLLDARVDATPVENGDTTIDADLRAKSALLGIPL